MDKNFHERTIMVCSIAAAVTVGLLAILQGSNIGRAVIDVLYFVCLYVLVLLIVDRLAK